MTLLFTPLQAAAETGSDVFARTDPYGVIMTVIAVTVVFSALVVIYFILKALSRTFAASDPAPKSSGNAPKSSLIKSAEDQMNAEVVAAIGLALALHSEGVHDHEDTVITMERVMRTYSPWSSKIYGLRKDPRY